MYKLTYCIINVYFWKKQFMLRLLGDFKMSIFRNTYFIIFIISSILCGCSVSAPKASYTVSSVSTSDAEQAAKLVSAYRQSKGLGAVVVDERLNQGAAVHARHIAEIGELDHARFRERIANAEIKHSAAENTAGGMRTTEKAIDGWKISLEHNVNMLKPEFTRIGFARADSDSKYKDFWVLILAH